MAKEPTLYVCKSAWCVLGSVKQLGKFTGGITAQQKHLTTGTPVDQLKEGDDYGDGFCPNCGEKGEPYDVKKATDTALADAKARHAEELAAIKEGVK